MISACSLFSTAYIIRLKKSIETDFNVHWCRSQDKLIKTKIFLLRHTALKEEPQSRIRIQEKRTIMLQLEEV